MRISILILVLALGCGGSEPPPASPSAETTQARPPIPADFVGLADRRAPPSAFASGVSSSNVEVRRAAVLGVARLHDPQAAELLVGALHDPDSQVRTTASLGIGGLGPEAPVTSVDGLRAAIDSERDSNAARLMLRDLGRIGSADDVSRMVRSLGSASKIGGCEGLAELATRAIEIPEVAVAGIAAALDDQDADVRLACAYAATRLTSRHASSLLPALEGRLGDASSDVEALAMRALAGYGSASDATLLRAVENASPIAAVYALRALTHDSGHGALGRGISAALTRGLSGWEGPLRQLLVEALEQALVWGRTSQGDLRDVVDDLETQAAEDAAVDRLRCLAVAAARRRTDGSPLRCFPTTPVDVRAEIEARWLAAHKPRTARDRLRGLYAESGTAGKLAVISAWKAVAGADLDLVLSAFESEDAGLITTAAEALSERPEGVSRETEERVGAAAEHAGAWLESANDLEGLITWLSVVKAWSLAAQAPRLEWLAVHPNPTVRAAAAELMAAFELPLPEAPIAPVANPFAGSTAAPSTAVLVTTRGEIRLRLLADQAPVTVARFVALAGQRFFDGLAFHRVVPGFVAQGGDPRGDGYGGPGYSIRCEDNRVAYRRGTVGMALAGRDTGGSQFFITLSAQPHLELRYTAFAEVEAGQEVADLLLQGDRVVSARLER